MITALAYIGYFRSCYFRFNTMLINKHFDSIYSSVLFLSTGSRTYDDTFDWQGLFVGY